VASASRVSSGAGRDLRRPAGGGGDVGPAATPTRSSTPSPTGSSADRRGDGGELLTAEAQSAQRTAKVRFAPYSEVRDREWTPTGGVFESRRIPLVARCERTPMRRASVGSRCPRPCLKSERCASQDKTYPVANSAGRYADIGHSHRAIRRAGSGTVHLTPCHHETGSRLRGVLAGFWPLWHHVCSDGD
jgi:hypothetical protein